MWIVFEGGDGCGKSTQVQLLRARLEENGTPCVVAREPGGTAEGEKIRTILLSDGSLTPISETLLLFASRAELLSRIIYPALFQGKWVLLDRFIDSTIAYQGFGRGVSLDLIDSLSKHVIGEKVPDRYYLLDAPPHLILNRRGRTDRFEKENMIFQERIREGFLAASKAHKNCRIIDACLPKEKIAEMIWQDLS